MIRDTRLVDIHLLGGSSEDDYFIEKTDDVTIAMVEEAFFQQTLPDVYLDHWAHTDKKTNKNLKLYSWLTVTCSVLMTTHMGTPT